MRECINMSLTLNNCIDCRLLQHYPALSLPVFPAACERLAPGWPGLTPGMMVMTEHGHLPCSPASDDGRSLVFSNGLDHSYLETLNIAGLWEHLDWIRSQALTCLLGLSAWEGTKRKTRRRIHRYHQMPNVRQCFSHARLSTSLCEDSWGRQGPGKAELTHLCPRCWPGPGLTLSQQPIMQLTNMREYSSWVQNVGMLARKTVLFYVIVPIKFIWRHLMLDIC